MHMKRRWLVLSLALCAAVATNAMAAPKTIKPKKNRPAATKSTSTNPSRKTADAKKEKLTLDVRGADCKECAQAISTALSPIGVHVAMQTEKDKPARVVATVDPTTDLGKVGKAVMDAKTPHHAKMSPSLDLIVFAKLDPATVKKATDALAKIKGVDAKHSSADMQKGELDIRIVGGAKVTPQSIHKTLMDAGIHANFSKTASS